MSIALVLYVIIRSKNRKKDLGFFIAVFGMTLIVETIVYALLRAYEYYPLIIPDSPVNDGVMGNIISQLSISAAILFVCVFNLHFKGYISFIAVFYLIENLFLSLGIYKLNWYKPWITSIGLLVLFYLSKRWYDSIYRGESKVIQYATVMFGVISLYLPTTNWIGILSGSFVLKSEVSADQIIRHLIIAAPKYLIQMNIIYFLYIKRARWAWYLAAFAVIFAADIILYRTNLLYVKDGFLPAYSAITFLTVYLYIWGMKKLLFD